MTDENLAYLMAGKKRSGVYDAQRTFAQKLAMQGMDTSPVQSPWQGVGRLGQALAGAFSTYQANAAEEAAGTALAAKIADAGKETDPTKRLALFSAIDPEIGLKYSAQSAADEAKLAKTRASDNEAAGFLLGGGGPQQAGGVIGGMESGGKYDAVGPVANAQGHRAYGKYQVLEPNIGPWTQEILGKAMTPEEFRANPQAQDAVFNTKFNQYRQKYGSDEAAARAWFAGEGGMNNPNAKDVLGTTVAGYGQKFTAGMGGPQYAQRVVSDNSNAVPMPQPPPGMAVPGTPAQMPDGSRLGPTAPPGIAQGDNTGRGGDGSGVPVPPQGYDPGGQFEAAARRAHQAGRGDIAIKYMQQATAAREAAQLRDANRTLQHVDLGDSIGILDPRSGQIVQRIPKGQKPGAGEGGAFGGTGMENQARSALVRAAQDPAFAASPAYAAAHGFLSRPRQVLDEARGVMVTLPPEDLSRFPAPSYQANGQPQGAPPQTMQPGPQAGGSLDYGPAPSGMPPAPSPAGVSGPVMQAPPAAGPTVTPMQGLPPKALTESQAKAYGFSQRMATANTLLDELAIQGTSKMGRFLEALPGGVGNLAQSPEYQRFEQAKRNFMNAQLRDESGAVIGPSEFMSADKQYFPQPGQETNKELIAQMAENRRQVIEAMLVKAGQLKPGERYVPPKAEPAAPQPQAAQSGPQEGATATNPQTGQKIIFRGGQWGPLQ